MNQWGVLVQRFGGAASLTSPFGVSRQTQNASARNTHMAQQGEDDVLLTATWPEGAQETACRELAAACMAAEVWRTSLDRPRKAASTPLACSLTATNAALLLD